MSKLVQHCGGKRKVMFTGFTLISLQHEVIVKIKCTINFL